MPRKPRPAIELEIQGLSDGQRIGPPAFMDDFTGQTVAVVKGDSALRKPRSSADYQRAVNLAKQEAGRRVLVMAGMGQRIGVKPEPIVLVPKGKRIIGTINDRSILMDLPKWRRI